MTTRSRFGNQMLAATKRGLVRGWGSFVEHAIRNLLLLGLVLVVLFFAWNKLSEFAGEIFSLPDWFGWPDWLTWSSDEETVVVPVAEAAEPVEVEVVAPEKPFVCDAWSVFGKLCIGDWKFGQD